MRSLTCRQNAADKRNRRSYQNVFPLKSLQWSARALEISNWLNPTNSQLKRLELAVSVNCMGSIWSPPPVRNAHDIWPRMRQDARGVANDNRCVSDCIRIDHRLQANCDRQDSRRAALWLMHSFNNGSIHPSPLNCTRREPHYSGVSSSSSSINNESVSTMTVARRQRRQMYIAPTFCRKSRQRMSCEFSAEYREWISLRAPAAANGD